jgi:hypothetical protein
MRQFHIDSGQVGGIMQVIIQSNFIFTVLNSIAVWILVYDKYLSGHVPIYIGVLIGVICVPSWWFFYYSVLYPSLVQYTNRQSWKHNNPIKKEFDDVNRRLDKIEKLVEEKL